MVFHIWDQFLRMFKFTAAGEKGDTKLESITEVCNVQVLIISLEII